MFGSRLSDEYELCRSAFGFDDEAIAALSRSGIRSSFASGSTMAALEQRVDAWLDGAGGARVVGGDTG